MKRYSISDVVNTDEKGIELRNGSFIDFKDCVKNYYKQYEKDIDTVAFTDSEEKELYIEFFTEEPTRIYFNREKNIFFKDIRNKEQMDDFIMLIRSLSYSVDEL